MSNELMPLSGCRVFVVEDEFLIGEMLREMLSEHGAVVIGPYGEPSQAYERAIEDGFHVGIVDINLTGAPAYDIADVLERQDIPFAFATGYAPEDIPERFAGVPCWRKPLVEGVVVDGLAKLRAKSSHHSI